MYWQLVGSLIYLTLIRPNILYTVGVISCYIQNPKKSHLEAVQKNTEICGEYNWLWHFIQGRYISQVS
jgi:hypothetical protein